MQDVRAERCRDVHAERCRDVHAERCRDVHAERCRDAGAEAQRCRCRDADTRTAAIQDKVTLHVALDTCVSRMRGGAMDKRRKQQFMSSPDCRKGRSHSPAGNTQHGLIVVPCRTCGSQHGAKQRWLRHADMHLHCRCTASDAEAV